MTLSKRCRFKTKRLKIEHWKDIYASPEGLAQVVLTVLTEEVVSLLPGDLNHVDPLDKAKKWILERDRESDVFIISNDEETIGFLILNEMTIENKQEMKLGCFLSQEFWGQGFGSELVQGLVVWCKEDGIIKKLSGGVDIKSTASIRMLEKNGFTVSAQGNLNAGMIIMGREI